MVNIICKSCGKEFKVKPYRKYKARFCSSPCWTKSQESRDIVKKSITKRHIENPITGENNPNWKGGITSKQRKRLTCANWRSIRKDILFKNGAKCIYCGITTGLHIHHIIPFREVLEDTIENLEVVCNKCHPKIENDQYYTRLIKLKCEQCTNANKVDCLIPECPLYPQMPYRDKVKYPDKKSRVMSENQKEKFAKRIRNVKLKTKST